MHASHGHNKNSRNGSEEEKLGYKQMGGGGIGLKKKQYKNTKINLIKRFKNKSWFKKKTNKKMMKVSVSKTRILFHISYGRDTSGKARRFCMEQRNTQTTEAAQ